MRVVLFFCLKKVLNIMLAYAVSRECWLSDTECLIKAEAKEWKGEWELEWEKKGRERKILFDERSNWWTKIIKVDDMLLLDWMKSAFDRKAFIKIFCKHWRKEKDNKNGERHSDINEIKWMNIIHPKWPILKKHKEHNRHRWFLFCVLFFCFS